MSKDYSKPVENGELREHIADVLAQYDRSRSTPTGDAVEIEIEASGRLVIYITDEIASVLDRIEAATPDYSKMDNYNRSFLKAMYENTIGKAIQAERAKLKERDDE